VSVLRLTDLLLSGGRTGCPVALSDGAPIRFDRFAAEVAGMSRHLRATGHRRAALVCQDSYAFAVGLFGVLHAGLAVVMPPNGRPGTLDGLNDAFDLLIDDAYLPGIPAASDVLAPLDPMRPALEFFTSGSTGVPKRIVKTLAVLEREVATLDALWGGEMGHGPVLATVSHQHIYGLTFKLLWPLAAGRPFAREMHEVWETLIAALPPNAVIVSTPAHLGRLTGISPLRSSHRPCRIFSAGAPLSLSDADEVTTILGVRPTEIFGSTETGAIATRCHSKRDEPWRPLPGIAVESDGQGRLKLRSPFLASEDWFQTADLIELVPDGFLSRGRADRIAKIEGKRISLPEVEQALSRLAWVAMAAVTVMPGDPARLAAIVVPTTAGRDKLAALGSFRFSRLLRRELAETQEPSGLPRLWRFQDHLPASPMGKPQDAGIQAVFGAGG
jgi:acyl-coenzyme A synthetase/AMP-(fatty) acid ligase